MRQLIVLFTMCLVTSSCDYRLVSKEELEQTELKYLEALANAEEVRRELAAGRVGKYQIFHHPELVKASYLVDTETGRVWSSVIYTNLEGQPQVWREMFRQDLQPGLNIGTLYGTLAEQHPILQESVASGAAD